jgi:hypothetical protein
MPVLTPTRASSGVPPLLHELRPIPTHLFLHPERRMARALWMVLMCEGAPNSAKIPSPVDCTM